MKNSINRAFGWLVSWTLFLIGDVASKVTCAMSDRVPECLAYPLYRLYQWSMCRSSDVQDWGGAGPWGGDVVKRQCDRCGQMFREDQLIPEEGDEWECEQCWRRCNTQERDAIQNGSREADQP